MERKVFSIHESLLSRFGGLKEKWFEKIGLYKHPRFILPTLTPKQFEMYLQWILTGEICDDKSEGRSENITLAVYYMIAEVMIYTKLKYQAITAIVAKLGTQEGDEKPWFPGLEFVNTIYKKEQKTSPARRLMVDIYVKEADQKWLLSTPLSSGRRIHPDDMFMNELLMALLGYRTLSTETAQAYKDPTSGYVRSYRTHLCQYHHHGEGEPCETARSSAEGTEVAESMEATGEYNMSAAKEDNV